MCIAHESEHYGYLQINGLPMTPAQLARMVGESPATVAKLMAELDLAKVYSKNELGIIYSRRMVKDEHIRNVRAASGKGGGGNPNLVRLDTPFDEPITHTEGSSLLKQNGKQNPTPSSSSSLSTDTDVSVAVRLPDCPHMKILESFGKHLPELPQPKPELWQGKNADNLRSRWKWVLTARRKNGNRYAEDQQQALDWFDRFFNYVAGSDFLSGRNGKWTNCDLGWLVKADNFAKVVQGNYENQKAAA